MTPQSVPLNNKVSYFEKKTRKRGSQHFLEKARTRPLVFKNTGEDEETESAEESLKIRWNRENTVIGEDLGDRTCEDQREKGEHQLSSLQTSQH